MIHHLIDAQNIQQFSNDASDTLKSDDENQLKGVARDEEGQEITMKKLACVLLSRYYFHDIDEDWKEIVRKSLADSEKLYKKMLGDFRHDCLLTIRSVEAQLVIYYN